MNNFEQGMQRNDANFVPLTPLSFLDRIKDVYPDYEALIYQDRKYTWKQVYDRCIQFASALNKIGIAEGDVVSIMAANTPELFEAHYSVPMTGGVINTINTRLDVRTVAYILDHSDCKVFIVDRQFQKVASEALAQVDREITVIDIDKGVKPRQEVTCEIKYQDGTSKKIQMLCRIDTANEVEYYKNGGILQYVLRNMLAN